MKKAYIIAPSIAMIAICILLIGQYALPLPNKEPIKPTPISIVNATSSKDLYVGNNIVVLGQPPTSDIWNGKEYNMFDGGRGTVYLAMQQFNNVYWEIWYRHTFYSDVYFVIYVW